MENIKVKLILPTLLIVLLSLGAICYIFFGHYFTHKKEADLFTEKAKYGLIAALAEQQEGNRELIEFLVSKWSFIDSVSVKNTDKLLDEITPWHETMGYELINIYDNQGRLLAFTGFQGIFGSTDELYDLIQVALQEDKTIPAAVRLKYGVALLSLQRIDSSFGTVGIVAAGNYLNREIVKNLVSAYQADLELYYKGEKFASSLIETDVAAAKKEREKITPVSVPDRVDISDSLTGFLIESRSYAEHLFWRRTLATITVFVVVSSLFVIIALRRIFSVATLLQGERNSLELLVRERTKELEQYRLIVDASDDLILQVDRNMVYKIVNQTFLKYWQKTGNEVIGRTVAEVTGPGLFEKVLKPRLMRALQGEYVSYDAWVTYPELGRRFLSLHYIPIRDKANLKLTGIGAVIRDQTDEYELRDEQARLAMAVEQSDDSIVITDADGNIQYVNPSFERITGYSHDESVGRNPKFLKSGRQDNEFYRKMWDTLTRGEIWKGEVVNRKKDGVFYTEESVISPVKNIKGEIISYVAVKRDVTRQRTLEEQLDQARRMEVIGRLAGGVAHDFNNMLGVILGYSEMIMSDLTADDPILEQIKEIKNAAKRSADITSQLLAFSRKQIIQPRVIQLNQLIEKTKKMLARIIGEDIDILFLPAEGLWKIKCDPSQIEQIAANLAINARDAMPDGGRLILETANITFNEAYCRDHVGFVPGQFVMLAVSDDGAGMDEETQQHIFEPFFTTKEQGKGTGLGLSMIYGVVKQNNGFINVYSEPGQGTTFKIYLPRFVEKNEKGEEADQPAGLKRLTGSGTILLVEDDDMVRGLANNMLEEIGYTVMAAATPDEAIALCKDCKRDIRLLLTDVVMPGMNGKTLMSKIEAVKPGIKTLFMSGYTANVIAHRGILEEGMNFIQKPFSLNNLTEKVRELLKE